MTYIDTYKGNGAVAFVNKLESAKQALAVATELPDIAALLDNAEAIRAAAKAKHVSVTGINAWMRFIINAERKGWARIKAMRDAGELPKRSGRPKSNNILTLNDLVPDQRAHEWSILTKLTESQLDIMERLANAENRLLTHTELLKLAKADTPKLKKPKHSEPKLKLIEYAQDMVSDLKEVVIKVNDDAKIITEDRYSWVEAWIRIDQSNRRNCHG